VNGNSYRLRSCHLLTVLSSFVWWCHKGVKVLFNWPVTKISFYISKSLLKENFFYIHITDYTQHILFIHFVVFFLFCE